MNLENYLDNLIERGFLKREKIGIDQVSALLRNAFKNIKAAEKNLEIDEEACYTMAYNSMIKVARAVLFLNNIRPSDGQQHKTTIEAAGKFLGKDFSDLIKKFDQMRKKRNIFTYEPLIPLSKQDVENSLKTAKKFYIKAKDFLAKKNSQLEIFTQFK
jgi:uncharacterized protein (UPF0332 family)